jgi:B-cell receptor-associated protein 31
MTPSTAGLWILLTYTQITFIFILILFVDSVNRVYRVQVELSGMGNQQGGG